MPTLVWDDNSHPTGMLSKTIVCFSMYMVQSTENYIGIICAYIGWDPIFIVPNTESHLIQQHLLGRPSDLLVMPPTL